MDKSFASVNFLHEIIKGKNIWGMGGGGGIRSLTNTSQWSQQISNPEEDKAACKPDSVENQQWGTQGDKEHDCQFPKDLEAEVGNGPVQAITHFPALQRS